MKKVDGKSYQLNIAIFGFCWHPESTVSLLTVKKKKGTFETTGEIRIWTEYYVILMNCLFCQVG